MNDLQIFNNPEFGEIRAVEIDGEPWFVGKDVASGLGYKDTVNALKAHVDDEDKAGWQIATQFGEKETTIINESGVYSLIFSSKLESAKKFKRWVTAEVLPSIRKHGAYIAPQAPATLDTAALQAVMQPVAAAIDTLTGMVQTLAQRMDRMEPRRGELPAPPTDEAGADSAPGINAQRRWMRTASEKLDLLSAKYGKPNNAILCKIYKDMEKEFDTVLADERYRVMEEQGLQKCSVLLAIFFDEDLRDYFQQYVDYNLAPENRGW